MINLPTQIEKAIHKNPRKLIIMSKPKVGKTAITALLPKSLLIDLENGSGFVDGVKINVIEEAEKANISSLRYLYELAKSIKTANKEAGKPIYDYIILDTTTKLEELYAKDLATALYKKTNMGQNFAGKDVVTELPNGAGYGYLRKAFLDELVPLFSGLAGECLILNAHSKHSSIRKDNNDINVRDLALTGKIKDLLCADVDSIGYLYRNPDNPKENIISFRANEEDLATGSRSPHLANAEFVMSRVDDDLNIIEHGWDKIFLK